MQVNEATAESAIAGGPQRVHAEAMATPLPPVPARLDDDQQRIVLSAEESARFWEQVNSSDTAPLPPAMARAARHHREFVRTFRATGEVLQRPPCTTT